MNTTEAKKIFLGKWEKIVIQGGVLGGEIKRNSIAKPYLTSSIEIFIRSKWYEISVAEDGEDVFFLCVSKNKNSPIPEPSKMYNPPRKLIETFPEDCRLDYLKDYGATEINISIFKEKENYSLCELGIILESANGYQFKIEPSEEVLAFLEISMIS